MRDGASPRLNEAVDAEQVLLRLLDRQVAVVHVNRHGGIPGRRSDTEKQIAHRVLRMFTLRHGAGGKINPL